MVLDGSISTKETRHFSIQEVPAVSVLIRLIFQVKKLLLCISQILQVIQRPLKKF